MRFETRQQCDRCAFAVYHSRAFLETRKPISSTGFWHRVDSTRPINTPRRQVCKLWRALTSVPVENSIQDQKPRFPRHARLRARSIVESYQSSLYHAPFDLLSTTKAPFWAGSYTFKLIGVSTFALRAFLRVSTGFDARRFIPSPLHPAHLSQGTSARPLIVQFSRPSPPLSTTEPDRTGGFCVQQGSGTPPCNPVPPRETREGGFPFTWCYSDFWLATSGRVRLCADTTSSVYGGASGIPGSISFLHSTSESATPTPLQRVVSVSTFTGVNEALPATFVALLVETLSSSTARLDEPPCLPNETVPNETGFHTQS